MNRPLLWAALAFAAGALAGVRGWSGGLMPPAFAILAGVLVLLWPRRTRYRERAAAILLFSGAGALMAYAHGGGRPGDALSRHALAHPGAVYSLEGTVHHAPVILPGDDYARLVLHADRAVSDADVLPLEGRVLARWSGPEGPVHTGERVRVVGELSQALGPVNHGLRGPEDYWRARGVYTQVRIRGNAVEHLGRAWWRPEYWASRARHWQAAAIERYTPEHIRPFLRAVWLGDRGGVYGDSYEAFVKAGTAHILAVSGVHVGIVGMSLLFLLRPVVRSRKWRAVAVMVGVLLFAFAAGARISSLRAAIMLCTYLAADLFDREPDAPSALSLTGLLFVALNPLLLLDTGFLLSFGSMASILLFAAPIRERLGALPYWSRGAVGTALGVQIVPLPVALNAFHVLPVIAPAANLIVVPLLTLVLWGCLLTMAVALVLPVAAPLFGHALLAPVLGIEAVTGLASLVPGGHWRVGSPSLPAMGFYLVAAFAVYRMLAAPHARRGWRWVAVAAVVAAGIVWAPRAQPGIHFLDVGQSDAAVVHTPGGSTILVDAGDASAFVDEGARVVAPFLWKHGLQRVDYAVVSHADRDHLGGLFHLLGRVHVGCVVLPEAAAPSSLEQRLLARCEELGVPVLRAKQGDTLAVAGATCEVLHPPRGWGAGLKQNERSLVLRVAWPGMSALFVGDIEDAGERALAGIDCHADILKVPHHGSITSSSAVLLDAVRPRAAVCSTRRPHEAVLQRYAERGISLFRTDHVGGIRVRAGEDGPRFTGARPARGYSLAAE